jgi:hypothetical protein
MRARQRHLNQRDAGATFVLDSRFINQSDGTEISQWDDRSGQSNHAAQATPAQRPTFKTAIQGGNGVARFDGSNDRLTTTTNVSLNEPYTQIFIGKKTGFRLFSLSDTPNNRTYALIDTGDNNVYWGCRDTNRAAGVATSVGSFADFSIWVAEMSSSTGTAWRNGSSLSPVTQFAPFASSGNANTIGLRNSLFSNGDKALIVIFNKTLPSATRKRLEHAAAFSFKIACN